MKLFYGDRTQLNFLCQMNNLALGKSQDRLGYGDNIIHPPSTKNAPVEPFRLNHPFANLKFSATNSINPTTQGGEGSASSKI